MASTIEKPLLLVFELVRMRCVHGQVLPLASSRSPQRGHRFCAPHPGCELLLSLPSPPPVSPPPPSPPHTRGWSAQSIELRTRRVHVRSALMLSASFASAVVYILSGILSGILWRAGSGACC